MEYFAQQIDEDAGPSMRASQVDLFHKSAFAEQNISTDEPMVLLEGCTLSGEPVQFRARRTLSSQPTKNDNDRLATPFYQLLRKVENQRDIPSVTAKTTTHRLEEELWTDKYHPKRFIDLIGADRGNLEVLQWATQWRNHIERSEPPPENKLLLISGPPGLGKTTLAHVVAQTAGFQLVEINASDERTGDLVVNKIEAAIRANSMLPGRKPNLLVIDEIDGAAAGSSEKSLIAHLVKIAMPAATDGENDDGPTKKKKRKIMSLRRPIICICNDLYVPALRPLRNIAQVITMRRPNQSVLTGRLREICDAEKLKAESKALAELADRMDCDVRASLHALQFITRQHPGPITAAKLTKSLSGMKDANNTTFAVYDSIFHADSRAKGAASTVLEKIQSHGEYDRLTMGVFELYPQCKFYDDTRLSKVNDALDWFAFSDQCHKFSLDERFSSYQPYALVKTSHLFAAPVNPSLKFPRIDYEQHMKTTANSQNLASYISGLPPIIRAGRAASDLAMERVPTVANPQLLKPEERQRLERIVQVMLGNGLTYRQERRPIDALACFNKAEKSLSGHENAVRQMIASQIEAAKIKSIGHVPNSTVGTGRSAELLKAYAGMSIVAVAPPAKTVVKRDFFGRAVQKPPSPANNQSATEMQVDAMPPIWFKYNEGYSNAFSLADTHGRQLDNSMASFAGCPPYAPFFGLAGSSLAMSLCLDSNRSYTLFAGSLDLAAGLMVGSASLCSAWAIGVLGDAGVRAIPKQPRLFVGMALILVFAEMLGLFGLLLAIVAHSKAAEFGTCG
ncbi:hypothetical protein PSACC_00411 [Paramicrosporidium saccamoebae]|uniref:AAA+ ATPase domain-containing protein n=1 Tax=Paramicrosporidium saccamoebae TaxID=1246581 RepID=A0A2H9TQ20_9FUNG|nr:hypothetical protein PSACC_00411 [Paramicrosporidium saccamoebae]